MVASDEEYRRKGNRAGDRSSRWMGEGEPEVESGKEKKEKLGRRLSRMGMGLGDWRKGKEAGRAESRVSVREVRWDSRS